MKITAKFVHNFGMREGHVIEGVVIHIAEGSAAQVYSTFQNEPKSSHYLVCRDGSVQQFVREENAAWHAGQATKPTSKLILSHPHANPNLYTIGIENEGKSYFDLTSDQYKSLARLVKDICLRYNIPIDEDHIIPHRAIRSDKTCPGKVDIKKVISMAIGTHEPLIMQPAMPQEQFTPRRSNFLDTLYNKFFK